MILAYNYLKINVNKFSNQTKWRSLVYKQVTSGSFQQDLAHRYLRKTPFSSV